MIGGGDGTKGDALGSCSSLVFSRNIAVAPSCVAANDLVAR
jgi:hypothetical protein